MSDFAARRAQRAATLGNDPQDRARWLGERMRAGLTTRDQYKALLLVGDEGAEVLAQADPEDYDARALVGAVGRNLGGALHALMEIPGVLPRVALSAARSRLKVEEAKAARIRGSLKRVTAVQRLRTISGVIMAFEHGAVTVAFDDFDFAPGERWISSVVHGFAAEGRDQGHFFREAIQEAMSGRGASAVPLDRAFADAKRALVAWAYGTGT
ncbi:MAG: hypothetical protein IT371_30790 [Deltaproteobacteria bacterium]|nr:hypothetical protein [Deltaproteobacteria bacterium]